MRQHIHIRGQPAHRVKLICRKPAGIGMLVQLQRTAEQAAGKALHLQVESRVIHLNRVHELLHGNLHLELLRNFAGKCRLRGFAGFNLATGELPAAVEPGIGAFHRQHALFIIQNKRGNHINRSECRLSHIARHGSTNHRQRQMHTDTAERFSDLQPRGKSVE